jgi:hypothetical protein
MKKNNHKGILIRTKNISTAMKLAVMSSLFFLLSGCLSESDTGGVYNRVNNPSGTVSGLVQDTNGNALKGATVSIAGQNIKTDAQGRYTFYKVPVSNVEGNDNDLGPVPNINVYVQPPEESDVAYLSATISVGPAQAEIDGSNVSGNNGVNTSANTITNGAITFVDGFVVEAPVAQLPALNNTVTGLLLDNTTGLPIVDKLVYLNISDTTSESVNVNNDTDRVTLQDVNIVANAVTNENGEFTIQKVPNDSALDLIVEGYLFESVSANSANLGDISTKVEDNVFLGNVYMTSITVGDDRSPMITEVSIHPTVDSDSLEGRTVARTIHIKLSENITTIPSISSVFVNYQDADTGQDIFLELASDPTVVENMITITTVEDMSRLNIAPGSDLKVSFARKDFADAAGNVIMEDVNDQGSTWLHLSVETFTLQAIAAEAGNPFVLSVDGVIGGITDPSVAATLVLRFNKPVQAISEDLVDSAVFVTVGSEGRAGDNEFMAYSDITTSLDAAGHVLTIELNSELPQNTDIRVELLQNAFLDEDDQPLTINPNANPGFDNNIAMGFVSVDFDSLQGRQATTVTLSVLTENDADNASIPTHSALFSVSDTPFGQLNNQDDDDGNGIADTADRLDALKNEINNEGNGFNVDRTLLSFALVPNAEQYELTAVNSLGVATNPTVVADGLVGLQNITTDLSVIVLTPDGTGQDPRILLSGVTLGDSVTLMPVDAFGVKTTNGTTDTVTLLDNTPPATVLQRAYSVGNDVVAETNSYGAGAELSENVGDNANVGVPFFNIVPQVLGMVDGGVNSREITDLTSDGFYDSSSFMAWTPTRTIGVALSEDVEVVPGANLGSLISGIPASGWDIVNDITIDDTSNVLGSADIATFTTDVMQLSLNQHESVINFGGLLQDSAGNVMVDDNGSKLILRDSLPPMVASSNYAVSADQKMTTFLTIVFNEAIEADTFTGVLLSGVLLPSSEHDSFGISADGKTVTLSFATFNAAGDVNTDDDTLDLVQALNRRFLFGDDETEQVLGNLTIENVEDRFGNSWSDYIGQIAPIPQLVVKNETELLSVEVNNSEFFHDLGDTESFNITYTFNQPVALPFLATATEGNDANTDGIDDDFGFNMSDLFVLNAPGFFIGAESSIVAISEENALRVNITLVEEAFGAGDEIGVNANMRFSNLLAANVFSRFDNNDSVVQDSTVANVVLRQD